MAYIQYKKNGWQKVISLDELNSGVFGRGEDCDYQILDPQVSRAHFRVSCCGQGVFSVEDLGSSNGTYLNERKLPSGVHKLSNGDRLKVRDHVFVFWEMGDSKVPVSDMKPAGDEVDRPGFRTALLKQFGKIPGE
ncbi:FHA domain-containing protein [Lentisphaerota bacterium ZTH]|nr:FHA domain-containing protein [Lentisphaerota bacterium]WET07634.1 FHA domain-containing protein [Lentisphaerota bacterium ZTH]